MFVLFKNPKQCFKNIIKEFNFEGHGIKLIEKRKKKDRCTFLKFRSKPYLKKEDIETLKLTRILQATEKFFCHKISNRK